MLWKIIFVSLLSAIVVGCVTPVEPVDNDALANRTTPPVVEGGVSIKQGTVYRAAGFSIGVIRVTSDSAALSVLIGDVETKIELKVGEEAQVDGYSIRNLGTYVDPLPALAPGSSGSSVTLVINNTLPA